jgi:integrase/recombinase XerD
MGAVNLPLPFLVPRGFSLALAAKGISVRVLASLAGHRDISVTQKYIDINDDMKRAAVELI